MIRRPPRSTTTYTLVPYTTRFRVHDRRLTTREERLILRYAHGHKNRELYSIVIIALATAMRQGEILGLRWEHINFKTRVAHLPETKNGTKRDIPLSTKARDALIRFGTKSNGEDFKRSEERRGGKECVRKVKIRR